MVNKLHWFKLVKFSYYLLSLNRYQREEPFTTLNVDIRNHQNLLESLEQYVKGDLLEAANAYHCEKCNKKVCVSCAYSISTSLYNRSTDTGIEFSSYF